MTGVRSQNAVIAMIYNKHGRISNATNKQYDSGEIVNFVQVDAQRLFWVCYQLADVVQMPFVLGLSFAFAFYFFGYYFLAGLGVFLLAMAVFLGIGLYYNVQEKIIMRRKDRRMKTTTESVNNIKMLKLYSWQDSFLYRIQRRRQKELKTLVKINMGWAVVITGLYLFPSMLPLVAFSTYIGAGNTLKFNVAVSALVIFNLMQDPLVQVPFFLSEIVNLIVSMRRIEGFLDLEEVQSGIIERNDSGDGGEVALSLKGNFSWGFSSKKNDKNGKDGKKSDDS